MEEVLPGRSKEQPWQDFSLIQKAWTLSAELHNEQFRKGGFIPYLSHLWSVAALVLEHGGDDRQVAAALLHDAAEDQGGESILNRIAEEIDGEVAEMVRHLSDSLVDTASGAEKETWPTRKERYLGELAGADERVLLVSACDKLHNLRSVLSDLRESGSPFWDRFNEKRPEKHIWYYGALIDAFRGRIPPALEHELAEALDRLKAATAPPN